MKTYLAANTTVRVLKECCRETSGFRELRGAKVGVVVDVDEPCRSSFKKGFVSVDATGRPKEPDDQQAECGNATMGIFRI